MLVSGVLEDNHSGQISLFGLTRFRKPDCSPGDQSFTLHIQFSCHKTLETCKKVLCPICRVPGVSDEVGSFDSTLLSSQLRKNSLVCNGHASGFDSFSARRGFRVREGETSGKRREISNAISIVEFLHKRSLEAHEIIVDLRASRSPIV
jgi:hypothetical protein